MLFVVERRSFERIVGGKRGSRLKQKYKGVEPFTRIEARAQGVLKLSGYRLEAEMPATVHEEGVLFLQVSEFWRFLHCDTGQKMITLQVNEQGFFIDNVRFPREDSNWLFYPDLDQAPKSYPHDEKSRYAEEYEQERKALRQKIATLRKAPPFGLTNIEDEIEKARRDLRELERRGPRQRGVFE